MAIALPARRATVGMVKVLAPAVRTRPPAAVKARLAGSKKGAGAAEEVWRMTARERATKPWGERWG